MGWKNLIVGYHALHNIRKACVNVVNIISNFVEHTPPTNTITNDINLTQYSIKQDL